MSDDAELARRWRAAAASDAVRADLETVYAHVADEIARRGPACWASGRCCNFDRTGHRLYVTGLEAAYCALGAGEPTLSAIEGARAAGGCPFQVRNLCGAHAAKPLGCRVYFCDRGAQSWQRSLSEAALRDIRSIHERHDIPYRYGEWRDMLALLARP